MERRKVGLVFGVVAAVALAVATSQWVRLSRAAAQPRGERGADADVAAFGAVGDGESDDTAALQRAIDAGGVVRLPTGVYRITRPLVLDLTKGGPKSLIGEGTARILMTAPGPAIRIIGSHRGTADPHTVTSETWLRERMPQIRGIEITGTHPEADGIEATGTLQLTVAECLIRGVRHAIHLVNRNRNVVILGCHIYKNRGVGIFLDQVNLHQINIVGCHISYCDEGGIVSRGGNVRNIQVSGCDIESNMAPDRSATANILLDSTGGSTGEVAITGCTVQHNSRSPDSANIRIIGSGHDEGLRRRTGSAETQEGHIVVTGNVFSDVRVNVHIKGARGVVLTGNTFWMGYDWDILVEESTNVLIGANNFDRNPRYNYGDSLTARGGIRIRSSRRCQIVGAILSGVHGHTAALECEASEHVRIVGASFFPQGIRAAAFRSCRDVAIVGTHLGADPADAVLRKNTRRLTIDGREIR